MSDVLTGPRLVLRSITADDVTAVLTAGRRSDWAPDFPSEGDRDIAGLLARTGALSGPAGVFGHRFAVERTTALIVGGAGFFGPPKEGAVEIGYGVVGSRQGRGYATEAVRLLLGVALGHPDVETVTAAVEPSNTASARVLEKAGFTPVGAADQELRYAIEVRATGWSPPTG